ncbi:MAG TPA: CYTH domain-containing protein [Bacilli bacterium]|nr:CYTH domain-containing protein [Bacilli bacterium]
MEIERKFLTDGYPESLEGFKKLEIDQRYLSFNPEIRLRKANDKYFKTIKSNGLLSREEHEIEIEKKEFDTLSLEAIGLIRKTRYLIPYENVIIEHDIYHESLEGLKIVEIEFSNENDAISFKPLSWFGKEVTYDINYKNKNLCQKK